MRRAELNEEVLSEVTGGNVKFVASRNQYKDTTNGVYYNLTGEKSKDDIDKWLLDNYGKVYHGIDADTCQAMVNLGWLTLAE